MIDSWKHKKRNDKENKDHNLLLKIKKQQTNDERIF